MNKPLTNSIYLFGFALVVFIFTGVIFDSAMAGVSNTIQRLVLVLTIILPTAVGAVLAVMSLFRTPKRTAMSILSVLLNGLSALFFSFLALFAG